MRGSPQVLAVLRQLLKYELTAINQSFLHARMCLDWGYDSLAKKIRKDSIANMVYAEQLIDRILFLEGMPNLRDTYSLKIGSDVGEIHAHDLKLAKKTATCANAGIKTCVEHDDDASRELMEGISDERRRPHRLARITATDHQRRRPRPLLGTADPHRLT